MGRPKKVRDEESEETMSMEARILTNEINRLVKQNEKAQAGVEALESEIEEKVEAYRVRIETRMASKVDLAKSMIGVRDKYIATLEAKLKKL